MASPPAFSEPMVVHATDLTWFVSPPRAKVYQATTGTALASGTMTAITWDTNAYDTDSMWSVRTPTRLTAKSPGLFHIILSCRVPSANYSLYALQPRVNGSAILTHYHWNLSVTGTPQNALSARVDLDVEFNTGDYLELWVQQNSGSSQTTSAAGENITSMSMRWVAKLH